MVYERPKMAKRYYNGKMAMAEGGSMLHEDRSKPSNLPTEVMDKMVPSADYGMSQGYDDLFMGVQKQLKYDRAAINNALDPKKW